MQMMLPKKGGDQSITYRAQVNTLSDKVVVKVSHTTSFFPMVARTTYELKVTVELYRGSILKGLTECLKGVCRPFPYFCSQITFYRFHPTSDVKSTKIQLP